MSASVAINQLWVCELDVGGAEELKSVFPLLDVVADVLTAVAGCVAVPTQRNEVGELGMLGIPVDVVHFEPADVWV
jgi:hypothetical protein